VVSGQPGYRIESTGDGMGSQSSDLLIKILEENDPRGGSSGCILKLESIKKLNDKLL